MASRVKIEIGGDTSSAKASIKDLEQESKKSFSKMSSDAEKESNEISKAFKSSGIRTEKAIRQSSEKAKRDFEKIKKSGVATSNEIKRAHSVMTAKIKRNNAELTTGAGKLNKVMGLLKSKLVGLAVGIGVVALFKKMTASALENEIQVRRLRTQVDNLGISYDENVESIDRAIQATSKYADVQSGDVSQVLQQLLFVTGDLTKSQEALNLVYDLANLKGLDVKTSTEFIGRALSGNVETLGRYFVEFKGLNKTLGKNATLSDKAAFATAFLAEKVSGAIGNMTRHELAVRKVTNSWASFVQFAGEKIFDVLDFLFDGIKTTFIGLKQLSKAVLFVARSFAIWTDRLGITKDATTILSKASELLDEDIEKLRFGLSKAGKEANLLGKEERKLARSSKEVAKEIKNRSDAIDALADATKEQIELLKKQKNQIEINLGVELDALNIKARLQKEVNEATEKIIKDTKAELDDLEDRLDGAVSFLRTIEEIFAQSAKEVAQIGLDPVEKTIDDIDRAAQELKKVQELLATNTKASIATAETILKNAATAIRSFNIANTQAGKIALQTGPSGVSTQGLTAIATSVQNMQQQVLQMTNQIQTMAQKAIPPVVKSLSNLQQQALQGKKVIDDIKQDIKDAKRLAKSLKDLLNEPVKKGTLDNLNDDIGFSLQAAKDLKDKLSEDTTATHTQTINTVSSGGDGVSTVQGFSTGVKLPGYGGGDKIFARLEAGERIIKKEAVRNLETLGSRAMTALHKGDIKGLIDSLPLPGYKEGGKVESSTPSGMTNVNLNLNNKTFQMTSKQSVADEFVQEIKSMNIIHGRKKNPY